MAKNALFSNPAFQATSEAKLTEFHLAPEVNTFNSVFDPKPLEKEEEQGIENLLLENFLPGKTPETQVETDLTLLKKLTGEIKAIVKQGVVLTGERVYKARELLKPYRDGTFAKWTEITFGSRRTAYNMLAYYELYSSIPDHVSKEKFSKLPQKAAYLLASKDADINEKIEIIDNYYDSNANELISLIQDKFPSEKPDGRQKTATTALLYSIELNLKKVLKRKNHLSEDNLKQVLQLKDLIESILAPKESITES